MTLRALILPTIWLASLPYFLVVTTQYGYIFWAPTMIRDALRVSNTTTGLIAGGIACVAAVVMLAVGASSDSTGERFFHVGACAVFAALGCVGAALLPHPLARIAASRSCRLASTVFTHRFGACPQRCCEGPRRLRASPWWVLWGTRAASWDRTWWDSSRT